MEACPIAVVKRCGRTMSPATKWPARSGTWKKRSASISWRSLPISSMPLRSPAWPMAETIRSASTSNSVSATGVGIPFSSISHFANRSPVARPFSPRIKATGITPFRIVTPSVSASSTSSSVAVISVRSNSAVSVTCAPWRAATMAESCAV